jgi:hypothetical protein
VLYRSRAAKPHRQKLQMLIMKKLNMLYSIYNINYINSSKTIQSKACLAQW